MFSAVLFLSAKIFYQDYSTKRARFSSIIHGFSHKLDPQSTPLLCYNLDDENKAPLAVVQPEKIREELIE